MTAASSLFNVISQVMGSVGIALTAPLLSMGEHVNRAFLVEHVSAFKNGMASSVNTLAAYLFSRGEECLEQKKNPESAKMESSCSNR